MSQTIFLDWNDDRIGDWNDNPFNWEFVAIVIEDGGVPGGASPEDYANGLRKKKRNKVKLIVFIDGKEIIETKEPKSNSVVFIRDAHFVGSKNDIIIEVKEVHNV
jgi:hypothetical protein